MIRPKPVDAADQSAGAFSGQQKFVAAVLAFLQFTIVLDFMVLAPLGVWVIPALKITPSQFGLVVSTYAFAAGISGLLTAGFADRFDRKRLLLFFYSGFLLGTLLCALASSYPMLLFARMVTGLFAGVVGSASLTIVTDIFPIDMRGRVMGILQTAFGASSVLGMPLALQMSGRWGWNASFFLIVAVGAVVGGSIGVFMNPVNDHLRNGVDRSPLHHLIQTVSNRLYLQGFATTGLLSVGGFVLMPFMSIFMVHNVGLPIEKLPLIYVITGVFSIIAGPLIGRASDSYGKFRVFAFGCGVTIVAVITYTHLHHSPFWLLVVVLMVMQVGIFSRMISASALMSALPTPSDRGSFMSISSSLQQMSGGVAAVIAGLIVVQSPVGDVIHFDTLGYMLVFTTLVSLAFMFSISRKIRGARAVSTAVPDAAALLK